MTESRVRSRYGDAIESLGRMGVSQSKIAKLIGCSPATVSRLLENPCHVPSHPIGQSLIDLERDVGAGMSRWGQYVLYLRTMGLNTRRIALAARMSEESVRQLEADPTRVPSHDNGERIESLVRRYRGLAVVSDKA